MGWIRSGPLRVLQSEVMTARWCWSRRLLRQRASGMLTGYMTLSSWIPETQRSAGKAGMTVGQLLSSWPTVIPALRKVRWKRHHTLVTVTLWCPEIKKHNYRLEIISTILVIKWSSLVNQLISLITKMYGIFWSMGFTLSSLEKQLISHNDWNNIAANNSMISYFTK